MDSLTKEFLSAMNKLRLLKKRIQFPDLGISHAEFWLLITISERSRQHQDAREGGLVGVTTTELVEELEVTPSAVSRMLRGIEDRGLIRREASKTDRRVAYLMVTEAGNALLDQEMARRDIMIERVLRRMGEQDARRFIELFTRLYQIVKEELEDRNQV